MQLLVDGHNLIGQMRDIHLDDPHDEARLAMRLKQYCMRYRHHCTVIFDNGMPGGFSRLSNSSVSVIFAPHRVSADTLIMRRIRTLSDISGIAIVTSDRAIIAEADRRRVMVIRSPDFVVALNAPSQARLNIDAGEDANPVITAAEVAYWLEQFNTPEMTRPDEPLFALSGETDDDPTLNEFTRAFKASPSVKPSARKSKTPGPPKSPNPPKASKASEPPKTNKRRKR